MLGNSHSPRDLVSATVPNVDQKTCPKVNLSTTSIVGKDAHKQDYVGSVTNDEKHNPVKMNNFRYEHFVAGISGGTVSTILLHPLDLLKIRFAGKESRRKISKK